MNKEKFLLIGSVLIACLVLFLSVQSFFGANEVAYGSVDGENGYSATTTGSHLLGISGVKTIKTGRGMFGSVVITGANTGTANFYNATTSNVSLRTGNKATSTILIASFPASAAAGNYVFDVEFTDGLLFVESGTFGTSTITTK